MSHPARLTATRVPSHESRDGFTLPEMMVVIVVIGIIAAIATPAILAVQEEARRTQCESNQKQIALATLSFQQTMNRLPTAGGPSRQDGTQIGFPRTDCARGDYAQSSEPFPCLDEQNAGFFAQIVKHLDTNATNAYADRDFEVPAQLTVPGLQCPSSPSTLTGQTHYTANIGQQMLTPIWQNTRPGPVAVNFEYQSGQFRRTRQRNYGIPLSAIADQDGASYTVLTAEGSPQNLLETGFYRTRWLDGLPAAEGSNFRACSTVMSSAFGPPRDLSAATQDDSGCTLQAHANHGDCMTAAMVDGSVRCFSVNTDAGYWNALCGWSDGEVIDFATNSVLSSGAN